MISVVLFTVPTSATTPSDLLCSACCMRISDACLISSIVLVAMVVKAASLDWVPTKASPSICRVV